MSYTIEAYITVPEQDVISGYGFSTGEKVEKFSACNRVGFNADSIEDALSQAVKHALAQWHEPLKKATRYSITVHPKNGPPSWKIEFDHTW